jgi:predicted exporter
VTAGSRAAVAIWVILLLAGGLVISRLTLTADLTALLPRAADRMQHLLVAQLRDGVAARLILMGLQGAPPEALADASRLIIRRLQSSGLFSYVNNGDPAAFEEERDIVMRHRYLLSSAVTSGHFTADSLRASLGEQLRLLGSPSGALTKALLPADPTGELGHILADISPGTPPSMLHGVWFSRDGTRAQLIAESAAPGFDLDRQEQALAAIRGAFADTGLPADSRLLLSGPAVFAVEARETIEADSWRLSLIAGTLVIMLLALVYRSVPLILLSLLPVLTGLFMGIAAVQLLFGFVHGITLGFGATLIGEAVDYPAYLFTHLAPGEQLKHTLSRIWPTLRLAVLTTVFGGLSMLLSSFTGLSQLGALTVVGVIAAGLVTRWIVPALAPAPQAVPSAHVPWIDWNRPLRWLSRGRWLVWLGAVMALSFLAMNHSQIWDDDLAHLSPISQSAKRLDEQLRTDVGAPDVRYLLIMTAASRDEVLAMSEAADILLRRLVHEGLLTGFDLPSLYLPSRETQSRRRAALPEPVALRTALEEAIEDLPFRKGLFQPFLQDVERARTGEFMDLSSLGSSALSLKLRALLLQTGEEWTALAPLRGVAEPAALAARIGREDANLSFLDLKAEADRLVAGYRHEALRLTAAGLVAITLILWWGLRRPSLVAAVLVPSVLAILLAVTALVLAGERLSLFHLVSLLLVLGIGLNYALFFQRPADDEADRRRTSLSLTVCIAATLSAFGTLAFSRTPVLHAIGSTVSLGAFFSLILSATLSKPEVKT